MTPRINGTLQPVRTKLSRRFDPTRGRVVVQEFESAGDNLNGLANSAEIAGMEYTLESNQIKSRLVMTTTGAAAGVTEQATSTWQLLTNDYQLDIRQSPIAVSLGPVVVQQIDAAVQMIKLTAEEGVDADPLLDGLAQTYEDFTAAEGLFPAGTDARKLFDLILHGVTT